MKILIISGFFLFSFCFSDVSIGQNFHGIAPGSSWIHEWDNSAGGGEAVFEEITIGSDTIINTQTYHKVISNYEGWINYLGAVRNDTASNQVKIVPMDSLTEYKLYDYGLSIGDTAFNVYYNNMLLAESGDIADFKIVDIDSFMINSEYYRRYSIENLDLVSGNQAPDYWYEGFGSYDGVLGSDAFATVSNYKWLVCCNINGTTYEHVNFPTPPTISESSSSCILSIDAIEVEKSDIHIYPNPSSVELYISVDEKLKSNGHYKLEIYSIDGEMVNSPYSQISGDLIEVNIDSLQAGMYILRFQSDDGRVYSYRIIKK